MRIAIVIGHEKKAQGATAVHPIAASEYVYNTEIAEMMFRHAREIGVEARIFKRDGVGIRGVYKQVQEWTDKDPHSVAIELHFNCFNGKVRGTETLYDREPKESQELARHIHEAVCLVFRRKDKTDRGIKLISDQNERGYINLSACLIPSVLVEPFFGDEKEEAKMGYALKSIYAKALIDAAVKFLNNLKN